jgi:hypothetical protein
MDIAHEIQQAAVADAPSHASLVEITPEIAKSWWKNRRHVKNRRLKQKNVAQYMKDMASGRWIPNNDAIAFDTHGFLLNGHHRLKACQDAGVPFLSFVIWNLSDESFVTMDVNAKRSMADALELNGVNEARIIGPALTWWWRLKTHRMLGSNDATIQEQKLLYDMSKLEIDDAARFIRELKMQVLAAPLALFFLLAFRQVDRVKADDFMSRVATGADLHQEHPILVYRSILTKPRMRMRDKLSTKEILAYTFKTWSFYCEGKSIKMLTLRDKEIKTLLETAPLIYAPQEPLS